MHVLQRQKTLPASFSADLLASHFDSILQAESVLTRAALLLPAAMLAEPVGNGVLKSVCRHVHAESMVMNRDKESLAEEWHQLMCCFDPAHPEYVPTPIAKEVDAYTLAYAILLIREGIFNPENVSGETHCFLGVGVCGHNISIATAAATAPARCFLYNLPARAAKHWLQPLPPVAFH